MRLLVSGATKTVRRLQSQRPDRLGVFLTPGAGLVRPLIDESPVFAADNGCFNGLDAPAFLRLLAFLAGLERRPLFVAVPDVVADATETLARFRVWAPMIHSLNLPVAFVGQDGLQPQQVPWDEFDAYFIGGSDRWKLSGYSRQLVEEAKERGKHVHMGRVNSERRIYTAVRWGCDTIDGTGFTWWSDILIPRAIEWIDGAMGGLLFREAEVCA